MMPFFVGNFQLVGANFYLFEEVYNKATTLFSEMKDVVNLSITFCLKLLTMQCSYCPLYKMSIVS